MGAFIIWLGITAVWLVESFFCYFSDYSVSGSFSSSTYEIRSKTLAAAVCSGDVPQPAGIAYILGILLLIALVVFFVVALIKQKNFSDLSKWQAIIMIPFAGLSLICAIFGLISYVSAGGSSMIGKSSTVTMPGIFIWIYISYFLTAGSALVAAIVGFKECSYSSISKKKRRQTGTVSLYQNNYVSSKHSYNSYGNQSQGSLVNKSSERIATSTAVFNVLEKVVLKYDKFCVFGMIPKGTEGTIIKKKTSGFDQLYLVELLFHEEKKILEISGEYLEHPNKMKKDKDESSPKTDKYEELKEFKKMFDDGLITKTDYEKKKKEILNDK